MLRRTPAQVCAPQRVSDTLALMPGPEEEAGRHRDPGCSKLWFPKENRGALGAGGCVCLVRPPPAQVPVCEGRAERQPAFEWVINTAKCVL